MKINYQDYLQSDSWKWKRQMILDQFRTCQICNSAVNLEVHHRTYERLGNEQLEDLTLLCSKCHELFHSKKKIDNDFQKDKDLVRKENSFLHYAFVSGEIGELLRTVKQKELAQKIIDKYFADLLDRGIENNFKGRISRG